MVNGNTFVNGVGKNIIIMIEIPKSAISPEELDIIMKKYPGMRKKVHKNGDIVYHMNIFSLIKDLFIKAKQWLSV